MSEEEYRETGGAIGSGRNLIAEAMLRKVNAAHLVAAELASLTRRLNEIPDFKRDPADKASELVRRLAERRSELLAGARPALELVKGTADLRLEKIVSYIGDLLFPWSNLTLPYFSEGIDNTPGFSSTSGA